MNEWNNLPIYYYFLQMMMITTYIVYCLYWIIHTHMRPYVRESNLVLLVLYYTVVNNVRNMQ